MSDIDTNLNNTEEQPATKNVRLKCDTEGESLPLSPAGKPSSATPSPRDSAPKTPECHTDSILLTQFSQKVEIYNTLSSFFNQKYSNFETAKILNYIDKILGFSVEEYISNCNLKTYEETQSILATLNEKKNIRKTNGVYYTEKDITSYISKICFKLHDSENIEEVNNINLNTLSFHDLKNLSVFDPTCGTGAFLLTALEIKIQELQKSNFEKSDVEEILESIYGNDLDEISVLITKIRLFLSILYNFGIDYVDTLPKILNKNIVCSNIFSIQPKKKFDIVFGNPPYVEIKRENIRTSQNSYGNLYADVLDYSLSFLNDNGIYGFIIPLSFISTPRMLKLREKISSKLKTQIILSYADRPGCLFTGVHQKLNILIASTKGKGKIFTNNYQYFYKEQRKQLFHNLATIENIFSQQSFIPKLGTKNDVSIYQKIITFPNKYDYKNQIGEYKLYLNMRAAFFIKAFISPHITGEYKEFSFTTQEERNFFYCLLNSSLFWWFWICVSDCWHITSKEFLYFRFPINFDPNKVYVLSQSLENKLEETKKYIGSKQTEFEYKHKLCISEIHKIDDYINSLYGLTANESNYIKNFALPYRTSKGVAV